MRTFSKRVKEYIWSRAGYMCEIRGEGCLLGDQLGIHHIFHNTDENHLIYGKVLQSSWNALLCCEHCHTEYGYQFVKLRYNLIYIT